MLCGPHLLDRLQPLEPAREGRGRVRDQHHMQHGLEPQEACVALPGPALLDRPHLAVGESSVILLRPPLPSVGVPIWTQRGRQQNDSLADGYGRGRG